LREKRYSKEAVERYGLIHALLRARNYTQADAELVNLYKSLESDDTDKTALEDHRLGKAIRIERKISESNAMIETLAARVKLAAGDKAEAFDIYKEALKTFPQHRALTYDYADALLRHESAEAAIKFVSQQLQFSPNDIRLYKLQAQGYEALGNPMAQHRALAEAYSRQGNYSAAVEQLQTALRNSDADFYEASSAEARLRELRELAAEQTKSK
jgi:beta-barrel assembly-enhancing protease